MCCLLFKWLGVGSRNILRRFLRVVCSLRWLVLAFLGCCRRFVGGCFDVPLFGIAVSVVSVTCGGLAFFGLLILLPVWMRFIPVWVVLVSAAVVGACRDWKSED